MISLRRSVKNLRALLQVPDLGEKDKSTGPEQHGQLLEAFSWVQL